MKLEPRLPDEATIGQLYDLALDPDLTQDAADAYFELLVERRMRVGRYSRADAEALERSNLGYYAGYGSAETRERVERLFRCAHPVFGAIAR